MIREFICAMIAEEKINYSKNLISENRKIKLSSGKLVEFGSKRHINELEKTINHLDFLRKNMIGSNKKLRKERYTISKAIESLRFMKRKAEKHNKQLNS